MAYWAYDFVCDLSLEAVAATVSQLGRWQWEMRESYWYGDYLNSRPARGRRLRIHKYPQSIQDGGRLLTGLRDKGYMALLQIDPNESSIARAEIDSPFRSLLDKLRATHITEIEPYD